MEAGAEEAAAEAMRSEGLTRARLGVLPALRKAGMQAK